MLAPLAELELAGQAGHTLDAVLPVNVPAEHAPHAAAEDAPVPALKVPAGQLAHRAALERPAVPEYVPTGQLVHRETLERPVVPE